MSRWIELDCCEKDLMSDSSINNFFNRSDEESILYNCLICMRIARGTAFAYSGMNSILQEENDTLIKGLSEYIHLFATYGDLLLNVPKYERLSFVSKFSSSSCLCAKRASSVGRESTSSV